MEKKSIINEEMLEKMKKKSEESKAQKEAAMKEWRERFGEMLRKAREKKESADKGSDK